jgi:hypothetical protein
LEIVGLANKVERSNSERANKRKEPVVSFLSLLSPSPSPPFYRGGGRGGSLLCPSVGFVFTRTPLGTTNGPLGVCIYKNTTEGYKRHYFVSPKLCNWAMNMMVGVPNIMTHPQ